MEPKVTFLLKGHKRLSVYKGRPKGEKSLALLAQTKSTGIRLYLSNDEVKELVRELITRSEKIYGSKVSDKSTFLDRIRYLHGRIERIENLFMSGEPLSKSLIWRVTLADIANQLSIIAEQSGVNRKEIFKWDA